MAQLFTAIISKHKLKLYTCSLTFIVEVKKGKPIYYTTGQALKVPGG